MKIKYWNIPYITQGSILAECRTPEIIKQTERVFERVEGTSAGAKQAMERRRVSCLMSQSRITAVSN